MEERGEEEEAQQTATSSPPSPPRHQQQQQQPPFSLPPSTVPSSNINTYPNNINPNNNNNNNNNNVQNPNPSFYQNQQQYRHFSPNPNPNPSSSSGMAIGVPAAVTTSFSSLNSFPHHRFPTTTPTQVRPPIHGNQGMGIRGTLGSGAPMRAAGIAMQHQQRPIQSSVRPQTTPSTQSSISQNPGHSNMPLVPTLFLLNNALTLGLGNPTHENLQSHGMSRGPAVGSTGSPSPGTSQAHTQPWLSSRPPIPNAPFRAQMNHPQALQQRSHIPHQMHHSASMPSQRPQPPPAQHLQQPSSTESQQQILKISGTGNQKLVVSSASQPTTIVSTGLNDRTASVEIVETCNRIISKRSIQELVSQIDPTERLDPEVEDILVGIAEDFVESITSAACSLAKHRKSTTLEAKDILLHLDRSWNMTLPGFIGDEIKCFKKTSVSDIHKERLAVLKKSAAAGDVVKSFTGQASGSAKGHLAKTEVAQP